MLITGFGNGQHDGSAIFNQGNLTLSRSNFFSNFGRRGGALYNDYDGFISVENCKFRRNKASFDGNDIYNQASLVSSRCPFVIGLAGRDTVCQDSETDTDALSITNNRIDSILFSSSNDKTYSTDKVAYENRKYIGNLDAMNSNKLNENYLQFNDIDMSIFVVNYYQDSYNGDCSSFSGSCNIRAAVQSASKALNGAAVIVLPDNELHKIYLGQIKIPSGVNIKIVGNSFATIDGTNNMERFVDVQEDATLVLDNIIIAGFTAIQDGAAINCKGKLLGSRVVFSTNKGARGGAVYIEETGSVVLRDYTFQDNIAIFGGDDLHNNGALYIETCPLKAASVGKSPICYSYDSTEDVTTMIEFENYALSTEVTKITSLNIWRICSVVTFIILCVMTYYMRNIHRRQGYEAAVSLA